MIPKAADFKAQNLSMINGFGLQNIGLLAVRNPLVATILVGLITLASIFGVTRLGFSGDNIEILRDGSQEMADYDQLLSSFRNFNNDAIVLMRTDNLATVEGIETYRDLHFEFSLDERVESVLSLFSLVQYDESKGGWKSAVPSRFDTDEEVQAFLKKIAVEIPNAQSLFGPEFDSAVMVVYTKETAIDDARIRETIAAFTALTNEFERPGLSITIAGQPAIRSDLIRNILGDLLLLAPLALLMCGGIAFILFRNPVPAVLCALPSLVSITWFLGGAGLTGTDLNFLTNILPVLLIVIVFADTLHLYLKWQKLCLLKSSPASALEQAIREIGPACAISSLTTAAALISLCASGNLGLFELGIVGAISVIAGFFSVIVVLPLGCYWAIKSGFEPKQSTTDRLKFVAKPAIAALRHKGLVILAGLVLCLVGLYGHWSIDSRFRMLDYLGSQSEVAKSEGYIDERYAGTTPLFTIVKLPDDTALLSDQNTSLFYGVLDTISEVFPSSSFYSLADFAKEIEKGGGQIRESDIDQVPRYLTSRFISEDKTEVLVTMFSSANLSAKEMRAKLGKLNGALDEKGYLEATRVTGFPILAGVVAPRLMDNLRIGLLLAVGLSILIVAISAGSIKLGLICLIPNLLPIVCVELVLIAVGIPLNMSITVALTVAFGIAVDDSIHMMNQYLLNRQNQRNDEAVVGAIEEVTPAIFSTTLILSGGLIIMMFSSLPAISVFSAVVILTLVFAFLADIFQLPAYLAKIKWQNPNSPGAEK